MNLIGQMFFKWPQALWMILKLKRIATKYRRNPGIYTPLQRNNILLKYTKRLLKYYNINLEIQGYENLPNNGPILLTPNHKSNMDPLLILAALESKDPTKQILNKMPCFLAKKDLLNKKLVRQTLSILDTFYIDRNDIRTSLKSLDDFGNFVKEHKRYGVIFPEGRRVYEDGLDEFKSGAFKVALKQYMSIVPVAITDTRDAQNHKRSKKLKVIVKFLTPIKASSAISMDAKFLAEKVKQNIEEALTELQNI